MFTFNGFKAWFTVNDLTEQQRYVLSVSDAPILVSETEKAVKLMFESDYGKTYIWAPKSALISDADVQAEEKRREASFDKYAKLIIWAKAAGVKGVRNRMKKTTVVRKIADAGLQVPAELA